MNSWKSCVLNVVLLLFVSACATSTATDEVSIGGLSRFDGRRWTTYTTANGLPYSVAISGIVFAPDGALWVNSPSFRDDGGVARFDGETWATYTTEDGLASNDTYGIAVAPDNTLWVGTASGSVSRYDGVTWTTYTASDGLPNRITGVDVASDGIVWVAAGGGVAHFDGENWITHEVRGASCITAAPTGQVWICGPGRGEVSSFDGATWTTYQVVDVSAGYDRLLTPLTVAVVPDGTVWVGTGDGLAYLDGEAWKVYTTRDGLAGNMVSAVAVAPDGAVWAGGNGLSRFKDGKWTTYSTADGLTSDLVSAIAVAPDGAVWVGTASLDTVVRLVPLTGPALSPTLVCIRYWPYGKGLGETGTGSPAVASPQLPGVRGRSPRRNPIESF